MIRPFLLACCCLFFCFSCERDDLLLLGSWQATSVTEGTDSIHLDPAEIGFTFTPDNRYQFRSTLRHREAGTWIYQEGRLMANDTTGIDAEQRVVAVDKLTVDSLVLRMKGDSLERVVVLLKQ